MRLDPRTALVAVTVLAAGAVGAGALRAGERVAVGDTAPAFALPAAADGTVHQLEALHGEASAVLVFFRGAW